MKKLVMAALLMAAVLVALVATRVSAQSPQPQPDALVLQAPGASIGVTVRDLRSDDAQKAGVYVESVRADSPAARAGVKPKDVVVDYDGETVHSVRQFTRLVRESAPGRPLKATVVRDGGRQTLDITPDPGGRITGFERFPEISREVERAMRDVPRNFDFDFDFDGVVVNAYRTRLGAALSPLTDQLADYFGVKNGALVSSVTSDSPAARAGLKAGDVITEVNGRRVERPADVNAAIRDGGAEGKVALKVMRDRKEQTLNATLPERQRPRLNTYRTPV
jgi:serine protease Do